MSKKLAWLLVGIYFVSPVCLADQDMNSKIIQLAVGATSNISDYNQLKQLADQGNPIALRWLGVYYNMKKDYSTSVRYYIKAAKLGNVAAEAALAVAYASGNGVQQNYDEAFLWARKAAASDDPIAEYDLGFLYQHGYGASENLKKAFYWYMSSAHKGYHPAEKVISNFYRKGISVPVNTARALYFKNKAASMFDLPKQQYDGELLVTLGDRRIWEINAQTNQVYESLSTPKSLGRLWEVFKMGDYKLAFIASNGLVFLNTQNQKMTYKYLGKQYGGLGSAFAYCGLSSGKMFVTFREYGKKKYGMTLTNRYIYNIKSGRAYHYPLLADFTKILCSGDHLFPFGGSFDRVGAILLGSNNSADLEWVKDDVASVFFISRQNDVVPEKKLLLVFQYHQNNARALYINRTSGKEVASYQLPNYIQAITRPQIGVRKNNVYFYNKVNGNHYIFQYNLSKNKIVGRTLLPHDPLSFFVDSASNLIYVYVSGYMPNNALLLLYKINSGASAGYVPMPRKSVQHDDSAQTGPDEFALIKFAS